MKKLIGAIEGGGTKFVCSVGYGPREILETVRIPTQQPADTLERIVTFFRSHVIESLGVAMFGPLELRETAQSSFEGTSSFGGTLVTPKPGWSNVPVRQYLMEHLEVPIVVDTDVNAAALAEATWGAAQHCDPVLYITWGTGIGMGVFIGGQMLHGLMHPEFGHILMPRLSFRDGSEDTFEGNCPFHGRCLEGLIAGPALAKRVGRPAETLGKDDPVWDLSARYLGHALANAVLLLAPQRIVLGGGISEQEQVFPVVRKTLVESIAGYIPRSELNEGIDQYVVRPGLDAPGVAGAFALALRALENVS